MKTTYTLTTALLLTACLSLSTSGCTLLRLRSETAVIEQAGELSGTVEAPAFSGKPIVVVLLSVDPAKADQWKAVVARTVLPRPGPFRFVAAPGTYHVGAFEDLNESVSFQADEPVGWHGAPDGIVIAGNNREGLKVVLRPPGQARRELPQLYQPPQGEVRDLSKRLHLGEVVSLDDPAFSRENGSLGLWEPLRFFEENRSGIFFLEPYDPGKVPILFIHGAGGNPQEWAPIVKSLDRRRFQPWVLFYPSGLRLDGLRLGTSNALTKLKTLHRFDRLYLVAHSMGGLVAGGIVNSLSEAGNADMLPLLVTISTPWGGHEMAENGVQQSPAVIPSWYDMVPGSPYQAGILSRPFPERLEYHLLFSHRGGFNVMSGGNTDGAVSLKSQLIGPAQQRAVQIRGFDEDHVGILSSKEVIEYLNQILERRLLRDQAAK